MKKFAGREKSLSRLLLKIYHILYKKFGPQHWWPGETPFEIMVGAILTQNTNWNNVERAIDNIKKVNLLEPHRLVQAKKKLARLIRPSGFYQLKAKRLGHFLEYLVNSYQGKIELMAKVDKMRLREELLSIPGIGKETADSILLYALKKPVFVVDAYTRRVFSRHRVFDYNLDYDHIRLLFEKNLPRRTRLYNEYHALLVRLGKEYCKKNVPLCSDCPLHNIF